MIALSPANHLRTDIRGTEEERKRKKERTIPKKERNKARGTNKEKKKQRKETKTNRQKDRPTDRPTENKNTSLCKAGRIERMAQQRRE